MKKLMLLVCILLCVAVCAYAAETTYSGNCAPIEVVTAGEHTVILDGVTIEATSGAAINVDPLVTKLTIVLKDGTTNTLQSSAGYAGIANHGVDLLIRCESAGEGHECGANCGVLNVTGGDYSAGIGGGDGNGITGNVTISGGTVTATGGDSGAGIGGGYYGDITGTVTISGGTVYAVGTSGGAGIGGGREGNVGETGVITVSGGIVTAKGNTGAAGIGGGYSGSLNGAVVIKGGDVTATGAGSSAGIGGGNNGSMSGSVTVYDGKLYAVAGSGAAGIGSGRRAQMSGSVVIKGGDVTAVGGDIYSNGVYTGNAPAIGAGGDGTATASMVIKVAPESGEIRMKVGTEPAAATEVAGSPFAAVTDVTALLNGQKAAQFKYFAPSGSSPAIPEVPETGDSMNFVLLAAMALVGMVGMTVILRRKNEA
ncbi:MAG: LPXTG cell wall anchor domain-containing protein [Clostridia bacterium]|nr:LPXTG cell wall anchor domain-containing protein [Clostridia bacterium]